MALRHLLPTGGASAEQALPLLHHHGVNAGLRSALTFIADSCFSLALMIDGEGG